MKLTDIPKKMAVPFGINGSRLDIDTTPITGDNNASYSLGFPDVTMLNESAGGKPPKGQNINQIFYELSLDARWNQSGGLYKYDSDFSTAVGGYPKGSIVLGSDGITIYQSTSDDNLTDPDSSSSSGWYNLSGSFLKISNNLSEIKSSGSSSQIAALLNLGISDSSGYVGRLVSVKTYTSNAVYTPTSGVSKIIVEMVGGGGGGGCARATATNYYSGGSGGGGGGYCRSMISSPVSQAVVVGAAGLGSSSGKGGNGGTSMFGSLLSATGGYGGNFFSDQYTNGDVSQLRGGSGGYGSGGNIMNTSGEQGGVVMLTKSGNCVSGGGGASFFGFGGECVGGSSSNGSSSSSYGGGGAGAISDSSPSTSLTGGNGSSGVVIIYEYA